MKPLTMGEAPATETQENAEQTQQIDENETRLLYQEFLMKPKTRVIDFLNQNQIIINDFARLECGESIE